VNEALENLRVGELLEDLQLLVLGQRRRVSSGLHVRLEPTTRRAVLDVHVLDADGAAVGLAQNSEDLAQACTLGPAQVAGVEDLVEVLLLEPEVGQLEVRDGVLAIVERIDLSHQMANGAVREHEAGDARLELRAV